MDLKMSTSLVLVLGGEHFSTVMVVVVIIKLW